MPTVNDVLIVANTFDRAGFPASPAAGGNHTEPIHLRYRNNPDGSIRWVWPSGSRTANCLRFYHQGTRRARIASRVIRRLFSNGLAGLFGNGRLTIYTDTATVAHIRQQLGSDYAVFTGTKGPNRKSLIWHNTPEGGIFIKVALTPQAEQLLDVEENTLSALQQLPIKTFTFPHCNRSGATCLTLTDLSASTAPGRSDIQSSLLEELHRLTARRYRIADTPWWQSATKQLAELQQSTDNRIPHGFIRKLDHLLSSIDTNRYVVCTRAHGDLTPWNMTPGAPKPGLFDWELSQPAAPAFRDAIHFVFQTGILLDREEMIFILNDVRHLALSGWIKDAVARDDIDFPLHLKLYLLTNCIYYLHLYSRQEAWHVQVHWLLAGWNDALNSLLVHENLLTPRQLVAMDLFDILGNEQYVALKWMQEKPEDLSLSSDIDICAGREVVRTLEKRLLRHPLVTDRRIQRTSFKNQYILLFENGSLLSIDLVRRFKRRQLDYLAAAQVLNGTRRNAAGVHLPSVSMDFAYTWLFYLLNHASVPERHRTRFLSADANDQQQLAVWFASWQLADATWREAMNYTGELHTAALCRLKKAPANTGWNGVRNSVQYITDTLRHLFGNNGLVVTFSGVDGAGKSTVIEQTRELVEKQLRRKVVVLRHRPSLLPILSAWKEGKQAAEKQAAGRLPRQGKNNGRLSSLLRFAYYYTDYLLGQFYVRMRYVRRGYVVIYDRYYFDFISDGRRSNISLSPDFARWFYRFLLKPDLNFYLYADAETIVRRKQELDKPTIKQLNDSYLMLFYLLAHRYVRSKYIPIDNKQLSDTMGVVMEQIKMEMI